MDSLNLVVNSTLRCLCCELCNIGVLPNQVQGHLKNTHKQSIKINKSQLCQVLEELGVEEGFPEISPPSIDEVAQPPYAGKRNTLDSFDNSIYIYI